ncbi:unnamed protein product, partial [Didymodactylos carnosus]
INNSNLYGTGNDDLHKLIEKNRISPTRTVIRHESKTISPTNTVTCFIKSEQTDDISSQTKDNIHIKSEDEEELDVEKSPLDCSHDNLLKVSSSSPSLPSSP